MEEGCTIKASSTTSENPEMRRSNRTVLFTSMPVRQVDSGLNLALLTEKRVIVSSVRAGVEFNYMWTEMERSVLQKSTGAFCHFKGCGLSTVCISSPSVFVQDSLIWNM